MLKMPALKSQTSSQTGPKKSSGSRSQLTQRSLTKAEIDRIVDAVKESFEPIFAGMNNATEYLYSRILTLEALSNGTSENEVAETAEVRSYILEAAQEAVLRDRNNAYGAP